jgi:RimJ/RimL family protein N-acetyltransferase
MPAFFPAVRTNRLVLRPFQESDARTLHRIYQVEGVLRFFPISSPPSLEKVECFLAGQATHWEQHGYGNWAILPDEAQEMIGWAGLQY